MAVLATAGNPHFQVSRREIDRPGISFTIDTVRELNEELGDDAPVYFVTGADSILEMDTWREPDAVLTEAQVVAVPRPGWRGACRARYRHSVAGRRYLIDLDQGTHRCGRIGPLPVPKTSA